jgi:hypothetical protein
MPDDNLEEKPKKKDLTPEELAALRPPPPLPPSEREVFEGKILELKNRVAELEGALSEAIKQLKEDKPAKKKSFDFSPI